MKLLNPGPVTLTPRVREALLKEDLCHREPEFAALQSDVRSRLGRVYEAARDGVSAVLLTGSGTAAVEAMIHTFVARDGDPALVLANGVYGERMAAMLRQQGKPFETIQGDWLQAPDVAELERRLAAGRFSCVLTVHHETTTGRLNDIGAIGAVCASKGVPLLLDAVSSFGGEEIRFKEWNLRACAATANKCLHGVPGISFVMADLSELEALAEAGGGASPHAVSVYLDLCRYERQQRSGSTPFTQSVHVMYALQEALAEMEASGGWPARHARYRHLSRRVFEGMTELGVSPLFESSDASSAILCSYRMPAEVPYAALHDALKAAGFVIYAGQGRFVGEIFRIAVMGDLSDDDVDRFLVACQSVFRGGGR